MGAAQRHWGAEGRSGPARATVLRPEKSRRARLYWTKVREDRMIRIALAVVAAVGLTFAADAQVGPLCQTPDGALVVCHSG